MILNRRTRSLVITLCLVMLAGQSAAAQVRRAGARRSSAAPKVRLVLGIMIDQFRADFLTRFEDLYGEGGFRRLLRGGANFTNARYVHTPTYTACGHATFMSGATPSMNGIIGNEWFEREGGSRVTSVSDPGVKQLGGPDPAAAGASPVKLLASTLGDELRLATAGRAKVIGIAFKDRSAILPAGKRPNAAYWFNNRIGAFVSSTYYFNELPAWVRQFNLTQRPDRYFGAKWERLLPEASYQRSAPDNAPYEKSSYGIRFPYTINGGETQIGPRFYSQFEMTPYANEYAISFARAAIENEALGADDETDLLTVSFSANDLLGHTYGPYSQEVEDMTLRTDRVLAEFFDYLDRRIGLDHVLIALSADHGVAPVPEQVSAMGFGGRIEPRALTAAVQEALRARFGEANWIRQFVNSNFYLDDAALAQTKADRQLVEETACAAALKVAGIGDCFTRTQLGAGRLPLSAVAQSVARGFYAARSGDLVVVPQPFYILSEGLGTTHGSPYGYDTHVPVILFGPGVAPGVYSQSCSPLDIAPTLAQLLRLTAPSNNEGRVLGEALEPRP
jgi:hypothetical protein